MPNIFEKKETIAPIMSCGCDCCWDVEFDGGGLIGVWDFVVFEVDIDDGTAVELDVDIDDCTAVEFDAAVRLGAGRSC